MTSLRSACSRTFREPSAAFTVIFAVAMTAALYTDGATHSVAVQSALGALAFTVLFALTAAGPRDERRAVWTCVAVATLLEIFGSIVWGVYRYRLHNIPLYVPAGHGLVYLAANRFGQLPILAARPRRTIAWTRAAAVIVAIGGLTLEPLLFHRLDVFGAFWCVYFLVFSRRTSRGSFFAAIFILTSLLEIAGTTAGDWAWAAHDPVFGLGSGNPPSVIAGGYCVLEATVLIVTRLVGRASTWRTVIRDVARGDGPVEEAA